MEDKLVSRDPDVMSGALCFVMENGFTTGAVIDVDGGQR
jgi:hypothetical protein